MWNSLLGWCKAKLFSGIYTCEFTRLGDGNKGLTGG